MKKNILVTKSTTLATGSLEFGSYQIAYFLLPCKEEDRISEDSLVIVTDDKGIASAICDGAGGHPKGDEASEIATSYIYNSARNTKKIYNSPLSCIEDINNEILKTATGARTTCSLVTIEDDLFRGFSAGDSEVLVYNKNCKLIYNNIPDSISSYRVEAGVINQEESLDDDNRHYVTNLLGDDVIRIESTSSIKLKKGDIIIIGSDGLFDNMSHQDIREILFTNSFKKSFESICRICSDQDEDSWRKLDDISFIMINKFK